MDSQREIAVFVDGILVGHIPTPRSAEERALAKAALALPAAAAAIRSGNVRESIFGSGRYQLFTGKRPGAPLTADEASRLPGAQFVPHPFQGL